MRMSKLVDLKEGDFLQIGGKAENLRRLIQAGFNVPNKGFVLTVDDLRNWNDIRNLASQEFEKTFIGTTAAVRSSAVCEDSKSASWAGQFKTSLFVLDRVGFLSAVDAFVVALNDRGIKAYGQVVNGDQQSDVNAALIVQEMVDAQISGVLFTANPLNGRRDEIVINSTFGIGESLVSGTVTGDIFVVGVDGKVKEMKFQNENKRTLDDDLISHLHAIGKRIEDIFGSPQDIEWAIIDREIYILQSRPITVVSRHENICQDIINALQNSWEKEKARLESFGFVFERDCYSDQNIAELLTPHPTPMAFGGFCYIFAHGDAGIKLGRKQMGYTIGEELDTGFFKMIGGQPRCSIIHDAFTYRIEGIPLDDYAILVQYYLGRIRLDVELANYPEVVLYNQDPSFEFLRDLFGEEKAREYRIAYDQFFACLSRLIFSVADEMVIFEHEFVEYIQMKRLEVANLNSDLKNSLNACMELFDHLRCVACAMFVKVARLGFFAYAKLRDKLMDQYGKERGEQLLTVLTSGLNDDHPALCFNVELGRFRDGNITLQELLQKYGHLGANELEIAGLRYHENSDVLVHYAKQIEGSPLQELNRRRKECDRIRENLHEELGDEVVELIRVVRQYLAGREIVKYLYLMEYDLVRQVLLKIEKILSWEDGLIFYLYPEEIVTLQCRSEELHRIARMRRQDRNDFMNVYVPPILFTDQLDTIGHFPYDTSSKVLKGFGVTDQVVSGKVVLVRDPCDKDEVIKLFPGCVLVTMTTDPSWAPLIAAIGNGGLVTEIGGPLAHGAIVARELGIAAVLNVPNVMQILKDGMMVEVNGPSGVVRILD